MNRLVLIGNGFDLAHGLNTRYEDFIYWYWKNRIMGLIRELGKESYDHLCKLTILNEISWSAFISLNSYSLRECGGKELYEYLVSHTEAFKIEHRYLFEKIHNNIETKRWVDIENDYYSLLFLKTVSLKGYSEAEVKFLNAQLDLLRGLLVDYLKEEEEKVTIANNSIKDKIHRPIAECEISVTNLNNTDKCKYKTIDRIMLLSFNYTKTPQLYICDNSEIEVNYIHGCLNNPKSIIFGYGDELDDEYKRIQNLNENECLRHIKSIKYLEADNYRRMLEFVESSPFQIVIMGHSCGNSDRTLLNTLFEHKNCVSIKPYYYKNTETGKDNYLELVQNISRNFKDMKLMRDRVVNKLFTEPLDNHQTAERI